MDSSCGTFQFGPCPGCVCLCIDVCPHAVFAQDWKKVAVADRGACMECGACALNCPVRALRVEAGVGCASGMINEWLASVGLRKKGAGGCC